MTDKEWKSFQAVIRDMHRDVFGGVCANDGYNLQKFGITQARFYVLQRAAQDILGSSWREITKKEIRNA